MPMSEACMDGIAAHGHRWRHRINLGPWPALLGRQNDLETADDAEVERLALKIVERVRVCVRRNKWAQDTDLDCRADDLEMAADCGIDEVNFAMGELYDSFDYWRILVDRTSLPAQGIEAGTGETADAGSTAKPRKPGPKGAPND